MCDRNNVLDMKDKLNGKKFDSIIDVSGLNKNQLEILCESVELNSKDFFLFHDYNDVLDVTKIHNIVKEDTDFIEGLKRCYKWYLENKNNITMKENVIYNENKILKSLIKK